MRCPQRVDEMGEQQKSFDELVNRLGTRDKAKRTMTSLFRTMLKDKYGGYLWFRVLISTGTIPARMLELANLQLAQKALEYKGKEKKKGPAPSPGSASAGEPTGSQHRVSVAKRQRHAATKILKAMREEADKRSFGSRSEQLSDADSPGFRTRPIGRYRGPAV